MLNKTGLFKSREKTLFIVDLIILCFTILVAGCRKDGIINQKANSYPTVILVVWDGVRTQDIIDSKGMLDSSKVPFLASLANKTNSFFTTKFFHEGYTYTMAGHLALLTGRHIPIKNDVSANSPVPTLLHKLIAFKTIPTEKVWLVATKRKICSLNICSDSACSDISQPSGMCGLYGVWGPMDRRTFHAAINVVQNYKPVFLLVSFASPDVMAHTGNYDGYIKAIKQVDQYTSQLYSVVSTLYSDSVLFVITTDHGRHSYDYAGHGDRCPGCTGLFLILNEPLRKNEINAFWGTAPSITHKDIYCTMLKWLRLQDNICT